MTQKDARLVLIQFFIDFATKGSDFHRPNSNSPIRYTVFERELVLRLHFLIIHRLVDFGHFRQLDK